MAQRDHTRSAVVIACACAAALLVGVYIGFIRPLMAQYGLSEIVSVKPAEEELKVTGVTLSQKTANLKVGDSLPLVATVVPDGVSNTEVTWKSSDAKIAIVSKDGVVSALKTGKATITVTTAEGGHTAECAITIKNPLTGVSVNPSKVTVGVGKSVTLKAGVFPYDADEKEVSWSSNNSAVATVDQNGVVTGVKAGTATITVTSKDGKFKATCAVTVAIPVSGISIDKAEAKLAVGETLKLTSTVKPENAANKAIKWETSDKNVATVDKGTVTALKPGTATITVVTKDGGHKATCKVTVTLPVKEVTLDKTSAELAVGKTLALTATISPSDATEKTLVWSSSDTSVATVDGKGVVTAVRAGTATITAKAKDVDAKATCEVKVAAPVTGVTLDRQDVTLTAGESATLVATVTPAEATKRDVSWASSDSSVATVSDGGVVSAVKAGKATVTVTTAEGGFAATCIVTVSAPHVEGVSLDRDDISLVAGESATLVATVTPSDAGNRGVSWSSSDSSVASVDGDGVVVAAKSGTATITVTTDEGGHSASCVVRVSTPVSGVALDSSDVTLSVGEGFALVATVTPSSADDKGVSWSSSDTSVATVDGDGSVTAVGEGACAISVSTDDGGYVASCDVHVVAPPKVISLDTDDATIKVGESFTLVATVEAPGDDAVTWSTSDKSVATVDAEGKVVGKKKGTATITATTGDGEYSASCTVRVK